MEILVFVDKFINSKALKKKAESMIWIFNKKFIFFEIYLSTFLLIVLFADSSEQLLADIVAREQKPLLFSIHLINLIVARGGSSSSPVLCQKIATIH